jgi:hypothetical protein
MAADDHEVWAQLAAGHILSSLDDADEAIYLEHAVFCDRCQALERDLSEVLGDLALATPAVTPPASLKAAVMNAVHDEPLTAPVIVITGRAGDRRDDGTPVRLAERRSSRLPQWIAVAAAVVALLVAGVWVVAPKHKTASVAARCAAVDCPVITLTGAGRPVAAVMLLDGTAYIDAHGLPATPKGNSYVLWTLSTGKAPAGVAAVRTVPTSGPVRAGKFTTPIENVTGFAISEERGNTVPAAPSEHLLAQGSRA